MLVNGGKAAVAFGLALLCCCPQLGLGAPADPPIVLSNAPAQTLDNQIKVSVPRLNAEIRLRNNATEAAGARVFHTGPTLLRTGDGLARPATWTRLDGGQGNVIPPGSELILQLTADLSEPGTYEAWIDTAVPATAATAPKAAVSEQPERRVHVVVTREVAAVPADLLVAPKTMQQARWPWARKPRTILIEMANTTTKPIEFATPALLGFGLKLGDTVTAAAAKLPALDTGGCVSPLGPGQHCAIRLTLGSYFGPGQYVSEIGVGGAGGGWSRTTATLAVHLPLVVAAVVTGLGVLCGYLVQVWRASGRSALTGLIQLGLLRRRVEEAGAALGADLTPFTQPILVSLEKLEAQCRAGTAASTDLDALTARVDRLATIGSVERAYAKLPEAAKLMLAAPHRHFGQQAITAITGAEPERFGDLAQLINDQPALAEAKDGATLRLGLFDRLLKLASDAGNADAGTARAALATAMTSAAARLPADATASAVAERTATLQTATDTADTALHTWLTAKRDALKASLTTRLAGTGLSTAESAAARAALAELDRPGLAGSLGGEIERLQQLWSAANPPAQADTQEGLRDTATQTAATPLDVPPAIVFGLTPGRSLASLRREQQLLEWATNAIVLVGLSFSGVMLVGANPSWGTPLDVIGLFLAGLTSRIVLGELGAVVQPAAVH